MLKFLIKFYDENNDIVGTIAPNRLKNKVIYDETINGGQGELILNFNATFTSKLLDFFAICKVYLINDNNKRGKLIYTGVIDQQKSYKSNIDEVSLSFIGLGSILNNTLYYQLVSGVNDYDFNLNDDPSNIITDIINNNNTLKTVFNSASGSFTVGETITGQTSGATATILYISGTVHWILYTAGIFTKNEVVSGGTSLQTATITWAESNKYYGLITAGGISSYGTNFVYDTDYDIKRDIITQIINFSDGYYYYIDKSGLFIYSGKPTSGSYTIPFGNDLVEVIDKIDYDIINRVYITYIGGNTSVEDIASINLYGLREYKIAVSTSDLTTAQEVGNTLLNNRKNPLSEIKLRIMNTFGVMTGYYLWSEMTDVWSSYTDSWDSLSFSNDIFDIKPGDSINIRNIDNDNNYNNLLVVKKVFSENYIDLYCNNYLNYTNLIK